MSLPPSPFSAAERNLLRHEFFVRFGQAPRLADGIWLRTWRGGPQAGQPKIPPAVASLLDRGLIELGPDALGFRARYRRGDGTEAWIRLSSIPLRDEVGRITGALAAVLGARPHWPENPG